MTSDGAIKALLQLRKGADSRVGAERIRLLDAIARHGSISAAAREAGLSYKGAWDAVQALNNLFDQPMVRAQSGGRAGGAAVVTPAGLALIAAFGRVEQELATVIERFQRDLADAPLDQVIWSLGMKTSARNALRGVVGRVRQGAVNSEVELTVSDSVTITAIVTREAVEELGLQPGRPALALIKSSFVLLAVGDEPLRISARNVLPGVIVRHDLGAVNDEVMLEIDDGKTITATITRQSALDLGLKVGGRATALVKASHVILAVE